MCREPTFVSIVHDPSSPRRHLVLLGRHACSSSNFSLDNLPASGGRMDLVARCIRSAFFLSDGIRRHTSLSILLLGGQQAPTTLRIDGTSVRFLRPDERRLAACLQKVLQSSVSEDGSFCTVAPGMMLARIGLRDLLAPPWVGPVFILDKEGIDARSVDLRDEATYVLGDHTGLSLKEKQWLCKHGAAKIKVGPVDIHAEDAIAILHNEIDRQQRK